MRIKEIIENATAGATSAGNIDTVPNPLVAYAKIKRKGKGGTPQAPQKKKKNGTAVNALDMKGNSLFGGNLVKR